MMTPKLQCIGASGVPWVSNNTTEIHEQRKPQVEPRMAKQQTRLGPAPAN